MCQDCYDQDAIRELFTDIYDECKTLTRVLPAIQMGFHRYVDEENRSVIPNTNTAQNALHIAFTTATFIVELVENDFDFDVAQAATHEKITPGLSLINAPVTENELHRMIEKVLSNATVIPLESIMLDEGEMN